MGLTGGVITAAAGAPYTTGTAGAAVRRLLGTAHTTVLAAQGPSSGPPVTTPRDPAREAARRELSKGMYHQHDPSLFQRVWTAFWEWIGRLLDRAASATPGGAVGLIVVALCVLAVLAALWWRLGTPHRRPASAPALFDARPRSAAEHRSAAEAHAAQGHWNQAVQERMRAIVRALEERALLDVRPGRTADEAAAEAGRALPAFTGRLHTAARAFDDVTYGGLGADEPTYRDLTALDADLERSRPVLTDSTATTADSTTAAQSTHRGAAG
uniref:DUF4129 domain-containing protein n=1 Tax=Streptomyces corallincola TaxID=2851888 RepID=UPI003557CD34